MTTTLTDSNHNAIDGSLELSALRGTYGTDFEDILNIPSVARLRGIGFLGTLAVVASRVDCTRWTHSIRAAGLALWLADRLSLPQVERDAFVLFNLLHDIGHLPHSHVTEPLLRSVHKRYYFHESLGRSTIRALADLERWCVERLPAGDLVWRSLMALLQPRSRVPSRLRSVHALCSSPISVDRVEGTERSASILGLSPIRARSILSGIVRGRTLEYDKSCLPLVEHFWRQQQHIYDEYVFGFANQAAEAMLKKAVLVALEHGDIDRSFVTMTDEQAAASLRNNTRSRELLDLFESQLLLTPLWHVERSEIWSPAIIALGARISQSTEALRSVDERIARLLNVPRKQEHLVSVHFTRFREFHVSPNAVNQERMFHVPLEQIRSLFLARKTETNIPIALFAPPAIRASEFPPSGAPLQLSTRVVLRTISRGIGGTAHWEDQSSPLLPNT